MLGDVGGYFTSASSTPGVGTTYAPRKFPQRLTNAQWAANQAKWVPVSGYAGIPTPAKDPPPYARGFVANIAATALDADTTLARYPLGIPPATVDLSVGVGWQGADDG